MTLTYVLENNTLDRPRKEEQSRKNPSIKTPLPTRSTTKLAWHCPKLPLNTTDSDELVIHPVWRRVSTLYEVDFKCRSPTDACFLPGSITNVTVILSYYSNTPIIPWGRIIRHKPSRDQYQERKWTGPLRRLSAFNGWDNSRRRSFKTRVFWRSDGNGMLRTSNKRRVARAWHIELDAGAGFGLLLSGFKIWCMSRSKRSAEILENAKCSADDFLTRMERAPRKRWERLFQFAI